MKGRKGLCLFLAFVVIAGLLGGLGPVSAAASETSRPAAPGGTLTLGKTYTEAYTDPAVYTGYDLKLPSSGKLTMTLDLVSGEGANFDFSVYDPENNSLIACELAETEKHVEKSFDLIGGDYTMVIAGQNTVGTVSFKLDFTPVKETFPETVAHCHDTIDTASKLGLNKEITGLLALNNDRDMYHLSIPKNNKLTLTLSTKDIKSMEVSMMDRAGNLIWTSKEITTGKSVLELLVEKGDYTLSVRNNNGKSFTGTYQLKTGFNAKGKILPKITLGTVKNIPEKSIKVKWKKFINTSAYEIQISKKKKFDNFTESVRMDDLNRTSVIFRGLEKKKVYYIRVRCFNEYISGKTVYAKWSKVKKVKIKK
ncbi:MAG: fibronectin type III domain-containing protein [Eubacterium sp.]|nr:fibronectin type III domain-containing protein [Eubacterium sp.]